MNLSTVKQLARKGMQLYPQSRHMRHQWCRKTVELLVTGKHLSLNGKFPERVH